MGLEPTTTRLRALRSADWARRAWMTPRAHYLIVVQRLLCLLRGIQGTVPASYNQLFPNFLRQLAPDVRRGGNHGLRTTTRVALYGRSAGWSGARRSQCWAPIPIKSRIPLPFRTDTHQRDLHNFWAAVKNRESSKMKWNGATPTIKRGGNWMRLRWASRAVPYRKNVMKDMVVKNYILSI